MCGIAGFVAPAGRFSRPELEDLGSRMAATLLHRGPDDQGVWADSRSGLCLAHRRLAIQDLSPEGHQPMQSQNGRYVLVFNGEIYNFRELRSDLEKRGGTFRGGSDTEVILAALEEHGLGAAIQSFVGMFAFALWDCRDHTLHLVRDRAGEKPLYYGWSRGTFLFGSELKALRSHPDWRGELDEEALVLFMRHNYIPAPHSIYQDIFKLEPGSILSLSPRELRMRQTSPPRQYWSLQTVAQQGLRDPFAEGKAAAVARLEHLLNDAVAHQMVADVPVGAFLSGGVDSSTIVALMQAQSRRRIKTFSIGFEENDYDEASFAKAVADHLGTQHTELYVHAGTLRQAIPRVASVYDEPFADTSHIPTLLLCELAKRDVTVCLSGDAGDELFGGYALYQRAQQIWNYARRIPLRARVGLANTLRQAALCGARFGARRRSEPRLCERLLRLSELLPFPSDRVLYQSLVSCCREPGQWLSNHRQESSGNGSIPGWELIPGLLPRMMLWDFVRYLPDEILVKLDRAAMAVSLETRIPLLDHRIVEFAWRIPLSLKQRRGHTKWLLRQVLYRYVPRSLVERPKKGFAAPVEDWIRGELRPWAEDLLAPNKLREPGVFCEHTVRQRWSEHLSRQRDWGRPLWNVLMFMSWWENRRDSKAVTAPPAALEPRALPTDLLVQ